MASTDESAPRKPRGRPRSAKAQLKADSLILESADFDIPGTSAASERLAVGSGKSLPLAASQQLVTPVSFLRNTSDPESSVREMAVRASGKLLSSVVPQLCPRCLQTVEGFVEQPRGNDVLHVCPACSAFVPFRYFKNYHTVSRIRLSLVGMSGHGKTMFLRGIYTQLTTLGRKWPGFHFAPLSDDDARVFRTAVGDSTRGDLADPSQLTERPVGFELNGVPGAGNLHLLLYDISGEAFETSEKLSQNAFFIPGSEVITFILSLSDIESGNDLAFLLSRLVDAIRAKEEDPRTKALVVVLTKGDLLKGDQNLPKSAEDFLSNEIASDPRDLNDLERLSCELEEWLRNHTGNYWNFVEAAKSEFQNVRYTVISSIGSDPGTSGALVQMNPRNVLSPLLWLFRFALPAIRIQINERENVFYDLSDACAAAAASHQQMTPIELDPGDYRLGRAVEVQTGIQLSGAGEQKTRILVQSGKADFRVIGEEFSATGISFVCEGTAPSVSLSVLDAQFQISKCRFSGAKRNVRGRSLGNGLQIEGHSSGRISQCVFSDNEGHGLLVCGDAKVTVSKCDTHRNDMSGLLFTGRCQVNASQNQACSNQSGIIASLDAQVELSNNNCSNNHATGIAIEDRANVTLGTNKCEGNVQNIHVAKTATETTPAKAGDLPDRPLSRILNSANGRAAIGVSVLTVGAILIAVAFRPGSGNSSTSGFDESPLASVEPARPVSERVIPGGSSYAVDGGDLEKERTSSNPRSAISDVPTASPNLRLQPTPDESASGSPANPKIVDNNVVPNIPKPVPPPAVAPAVIADSGLKATPDEPSSVARVVARIADKGKPEKSQPAPPPPIAALRPAIPDSSLKPPPRNERPSPRVDPKIEKAKRETNAGQPLSASERSNSKNDEASRLCANKKYRDAKLAYEQSIQYDNTNPRPKMNLARMLASCPDSSIRNGTRAVELATAGCAQTEDPEWRYLAIVDAAYAEAGNFDEAIRWGLDAKAKAAGSDAGAMDVNLSLFRNGLPCRWETKR